MSQTCRESSKRFRSFHSDHKTEAVATFQASSNPFFLDKAGEMFTLFLLLENQYQRHEIAIEMQTKALNKYCKCPEESNVPSMQKRGCKGISWDMSLVCVCKGELMGTACSEGQLFLGY